MMREFQLFPTDIRPMRTTALLICFELNPKPLSLYRKIFTAEEILEVDSLVFKHKVAH